ncbi:MAG TPA: sigma-70 family RNA polymerase sigma factor [Acidimicrobiales bacterium]|nr:sigma-70 family RNA polymerase sigma factor [Acidimicrobiales bacterium]
MRFVEEGVYRLDAESETSVAPPLDEPDSGAEPVSTEETGDRAFEAAYDDLFRAGYRVSFRILGSRPEAEDVTQEALTRAYLRWRKIHPYAEAWVSRVASNLAIDAWRRRKPAGLRVVDDEIDHHIELGDRLDLLRLLDALPRRQRQVLVLRYLADQTEQATADALGCSVGSVKRHSHRALNALRARSHDTTER